MQYCINCGEELAEDAAVCPACGVNQRTVLEGAHGERDENQKYCRNCGELIYKQAELCPECGVRQHTQSATRNEQVAAGVLALLLGGIGVHKFYQGRTKLGLIYLCFSWTLIPALIGFIEGILILLADEAEYERKYASGDIFGE